MSRPTGRPPKPTELKILGGNAGKRSLKSRVAGVLPAGVPEPPESLGEVGRQAWSLYWEHGRAWLALTDIPVLTQLCEYHDLRDAMATTIRREGFTVESEKTGRSFTHHMFNDLRGLDAAIRELWSLCHMTPVDRGRANVKPVEADPLRDWMDGKTG